MDTEIKEILEKRGFKEISNFDENGTETTYFVLGDKEDGYSLLRIELTDSPDDEVLEELGLEIPA